MPQLILLISSQIFSQLALSSQEEIQPQNHFSAEESSDYVLLKGVHLFPIAIISSGIF